MKRIFFVLFIVMTFFGCQKSNEDKIEKSFKDYVRVNFDNPDDLKEIVSIEFKDTLSQKEIINEAKNLILENKKIQDTNNRLSNELQEIQNNKKLSLYIESKINDSSIGDSIRKKYKKCLKITEYNIENLNEYQTSLKIVENYIDFVSKHDTIYYGYQIKYRINKNNKIKLETIDCRINSVTQKIDFYDIFEPRSDNELQFILNISTIEFNHKLELVKFECYRDILAILNYYKEIYDKKTKNN